MTVLRHLLAVVALGITGGVVGCSASAATHVRESNAPRAPTVAAMPPADSGLDLSGAWATGSAGEPSATRVMISPPCNYSPARWIIEQSGNVVQLWVMPASYAKGVPTAPAVSNTPAEGRVTGVNVVIATGGARYVLRYDSTSGHLRGTMNGAPFWAVRQDIVRTEQCLPLP